jgi:hypothetical protein
MKQIVWPIHFFLKFYSFRNIEKSVIDHVMRALPNLF